jgi:exodeoxyribonuclease-5
MSLINDTVTLSPDQLRAVETVKQWWTDQDRQVFRLFGHAGVGKTFLAKHIVAELGIAPNEVYYAAFTGKAAYRLRQKGCFGAMTIHKLIYIPVMRAKQRLEELLREHEKAGTARRLELAKLIEEERKALSQPGFVLNPDSPLNDAKLVVIDEVSMVNDKMAADLLSFGVPVLVIGDPAQLPPVRGTGYFMNDEPDVLLTEPQRFGGLSSVIKVATAIRHGDGRNFGVDGMIAGDDDGPPSGRWDRPITVEQAMRFSAIVCWKNDTRWRINRMLRAAHGYDGDIPNPGEKVIILANNYDLGVYNGQQLRVTGARTRDGIMDLTGVDMDGEDAPYEIPVLLGGFLGKKQQEQAEREARGMRVGRGTGVATFSYAITTHKFQGSDADKVLVIDESHGVRYMSGDDQARAWLYTSVTRAAKQTIIAPGIVRG